MPKLHVRGARENNLRDIDVDLELGRLVVFCGPSGSGKSSLAFETLHREGQRRYLEALLVRGQGVNRRPDVVSIEGLPPTIGLDQRVRRAAEQQTVAGVTELEAPLAVLFGRCGTAHCPRCSRAIHPVTHDAIVAELLRLPEGTRLTLEAPLKNSAAVLDEVRRAGFSRIRVDQDILRIEDVGTLEEDAEVRVVVDRIKVSADRRARLHDAVRLASRAGRGVVVACHGAEQVFVDRPLCLHDGLELPPLEPSRFRLRAGEERFGLDEAAAVVTVGGMTLDSLLSGPVEALPDRLATLRIDPIAEGVIADLVRRCGVLVDLGLGALEAGRSAAAVSRGESVRLRLARQVSSRVSGVLYVLDEPAAGLDTLSAEAVVKVVRSLVDQGNSVIAVDHHPALIRVADEVLEFGPGPGPLGGEVVFQGLPSELSTRSTPTGLLLAGSLLPAPASPLPGDTVTLAGVTIARPGITVLAGPSGAGKTRLLAEVARCAPEVFESLVRADVRSLSRTRRSNTATYSRLWGVVRDLLAQTREARVQGLSASAFSLNTKGGRCEACQGAGEIRTVLDPLPDVWTRCHVCLGRRFQADVLEVRWRGHAPDELLALDVHAAHQLLAGNPGMERILRALSGCGLGYVQLGRATDTLSGGEMRRLQLARELARQRSPPLVLADDPSLGLHPTDTIALMTALSRLAEGGAAVVLASADPFVIGSAHTVFEVG